MIERAFRDAAELAAAARQEEPGASRFAMQIILVSGLSTWSDLLTALAPDWRLFRLSTLCADADLMPYVGNLKTQLEAEPADRILLAPVGEVLQLDRKVPLGVWVQWEMRGKRILVPVFERRDLLITSLERVGRYAEGECIVWTLTGAGQVDVHAVPFAIAAAGAQVVQGVRAYLNLWENGGAERIQLISQWSQHWVSASRVGAFTFRSSPDAYSAFCALIPNVRVSSADGEAGQWEWLAGQAVPGEPFEQLAGRLLNKIRGDVQELAQDWPHFCDNERWLARLWIRMMPQGLSFADRVFQASVSWRDVGRVAASLGIRESLAHQHLVERSRWLRQLFVDSELPSEWWLELAGQPDPLLRLQALPGFTPRQQEEIVRTVQELMRAGCSEEKWLPILRVTFPLLAVYLTAFPERDPFLCDYFRVYSRSRILDAPDDRLLQWGIAWASEKRLWTIRTRASHLSEAQKPGTVRLWVDALGVEWAGLLQHLIDDDVLQCSMHIARSELPSSTEYNREWVDGEAVYRNLDGIAHSVGYEFPRALVQELTCIAEVAAQVRQACEQAPRVLVTGDHGLTRFASCGDRVTPPDGWQVHKWGRYADSGDPSLSSSDSSADWHQDNGCLVLARHGLFTGGSSVKGEVHGGALPEESLVPVLVVQKRRTARPTARFSQTQLRSDRQGTYRVAVIASQPVEELKLTVGLRSWPGEQLPGNEWQFSLSGLSAGSYTASLYYEGGLLATEVLEVLPRGISRDDMGLPDKE